MSSTSETIPGLRGPVDPAVRPQDDLFGHVNNHWLQTVEIPADRGRYGAFDVLRERAEQDVRRVDAELLERDDGVGVDLLGRGRAGRADLNPPLGAES